MIGSVQNWPHFWLSIFLLFALTSFVTTADSSCSDTASLYYCPNCGGIELEDCFDCTGYLSTDTQHDICIHRKLFQPKNTNPQDPDNHYHYLWNDLVGALVWFLTAGVATACGVGGGGIYVPLGILLLQFSPKQASGLSQASIFGASLGGLLLNARARHPSKHIRDDPGVLDDKGRRTVQVNLNKQQEQAYMENGGTCYYRRPLIHYDMALFLAPMEMAGAVLGVLIQKMLPNWLYLLIAALVLFLTSNKTYQKYTSVHLKEKQARQEQAETERHHNDDEDGEEADASGEDTPVTPSESIKVDEPELVEMIESGKKDKHGELESTTDNSHASGTCDEENATGDGQEIERSASEGGVEKPLDTDKNDAELRKKYLKEDMRQYPKEKIFALVLLWIVLFVLTLMKGGKGVESLVGITCESPWYGVLIAFQFIWLFVFSAYFGVKLVKKQAARVAVHYPYLPDDPVWDRKSLRFYGGFTFVAGIVAGLIGIGGGMVLGPLMLVMGIHPRVSSATTATMIVLTSSSVAVIYVTSGLVPWSYALFFFFVCLFGALVGKSIIDGYVKRTGRASILIFILATIIALATIGCVVIMLTRLADKGWCLDGFNKFCTVTDEEECAANRLLASFMS